MSGSCSLTHASAANVSFHNRMSGERVHVTHRHTAYFRVYNIYIYLSQDSVAEKFCVHPCKLDMHILYYIGIRIKASHVMWYKMHTFSVSVQMIFNCFCGSPSLTYDDDNGDGDGDAHLVGLCSVFNRFCFGWWGDFYHTLLNECTFQGDLFL